MKTAPAFGEVFINTNTDDLIECFDRDDSAYLFTRTNHDEPLRVPTTLWFDDDVDYFESIGRR